MTDYYDTEDDDGAVDYDADEPDPAHDDPPDYAGETDEANP